MIQWEYRVFECKGLKVEETLDQYGKDGWELVALVNDTFYMKRERESKENKSAQ